MHLIQFVIFRYSVCNWCVHNTKVLEVDPQNFLMAIFTDFKSLQLPHTGTPGLPYYGRSWPWMCPTGLPNFVTIGLELLAWSEPMSTWAKSHFFETYYN